VTRYVASRRAEAAVATINLELGHLRRMFRLARKKVPQECVPEIVLLKGAHVRHDVLEDADLAALLKHLAPHHAAAITGLAETGWREEEILGLEWARVSWEGQDIRLDEGDTKGGEARYLSFASHPALRALLERQAEVHKDIQAGGTISPWIFPHRDGRRITKSALQCAWRQARAAAGIVAAEGPFIHGLRRKMCKELLDSGVSEPDAMRVTGHKTSITFRRYALRDRAAQDRALAARAALRASRPTTERSVVFQKHLKQITS
jgi:integrase